MKKHFIFTLLLLNINLIGWSQNATQRHTDSIINAIESIYGVEGDPIIDNRISYKINHNKAINIALDRGIPIPKFELFGYDSFEYWEYTLSMLHGCTGTSIFCIRVDANSGELTKVHYVQQYGRPPR